MFHQHFGGIQWRLIVERTAEPLVARSHAKHFRARLFLAQPLAVVHQAVARLHHLVHEMLDRVVDVGQSGERVLKGIVERLEEDQFGQLYEKGANAILRDSLIRSGLVTLFS